MNKEILAREIIETFETVRAEKLLDRLRFTVKGENILLLVLDNLGGASTPSELIERLDYSAARLSAVTKALESKGYIERKQHNEDKRRTTVALTEKGRELSGELKNEIIQNASNIVEELGEEDVLELLRIVRRFVQLECIQ